MATTRHPSDRSDDNQDREMGSDCQLRSAAGGQQGRPSPVLVSPGMERQLQKAGTALNGIAAEIGQLAGKTDPLSTAIRDRLTSQFSQRYDEKTSLQAQLRQIEAAAPLLGNDLTRGREAIARHGVALSTARAAMAQIRGLTLGRG